MLPEERSIQLDGARLSFREGSSRHLAGRAATGRRRLKPHFFVIPSNARDLHSDWDPQHSSF